MKRGAARVPGRVFRRTLFGRLFINNLIVSLLVLIALSTTLLTVLQITGYNREVANLQYAARDLAHIQQMINGRYATMRAFTDACTTWVQRGVEEIWYVNRITNVMMLINSSTQEEAQLSQEQVANLLGQIYSGNEIVRRGAFSARFTVDTLTVGVPVADARFNVAVGAVFVHTRYARFTDSFLLLLRQIAMTALVVFLLSAALTYYMARRMAMPLLEMASAAKNYSKGDFSARLVYKRSDEIGDLVHAMNSMAGELGRLELMRSGFVANVSHELRSPLTSLQGYLQAMLDSTIPPGEQPGYLGILLDETRRMTGLVNDLLDLSRLESGASPLKRVRVDINETIRRVLIRFDRRIEEKGLTIEVLFRTEQLMLSADPDRMDQVFANLIDNAIKFSHAQGNIKIWTQRADDAAYINIEDNGPGIKAEDLPFIFERFYKAEKAHTSGQGTGLGLSIAKHIVEQHGGSIQVASAEGRGAAFVVKLMAGGH